MPVLTVTETEYSDYEQTYTVGTGSAQQGRTAQITVPDQDGTVTFTNKKEAIIDTGIDLDFLPYVLLLGAVAAAGAALFFRRRKEV